MIQEIFNRVISIDFPAIILLLIFLLGCYVVFKTQSANNNFDFADMLRDDSQKPSAFRLAIFVCLAVSTWAVMYMLIKGNGVIDQTIFIAYMVTWSGVKVIEKFLDKWTPK